MQSKSLSAPWYKYIPPALLIGFGWYAEIFWYFVRFTADGNAALLAAAQGIALTLFLSVAVVLPRSFWKVALMASLVIYSVFATTSGQAYNLDVVRLANVAEQTEAQQARRQLERIESLIEDKVEEIARLNQIKAEQTTSIADQSMWRTALANLNEDVAELEDDVRTLEADKLALVQIGAVRPDDIYTRYSKLSGLSVTFIETVFQLSLSLFIALMAPVGISLWPKSQKQALKTGTFASLLPEVRESPVTPSEPSMVSFDQSMKEKPAEPSLKADSSPVAVKPLKVDRLRPVKLETVPLEKVREFVAEYWPENLPEARWWKKKELIEDGFPVEYQRQLWRALKKIGVIVKDGENWKAGKNRQQALDVLDSMV